MYRKVVLALALLGISIFAGYAYFTNDTVIEMPNATIFFFVSDLDKVFLSVYRLNVDPVVLFTTPNLSYEELKEKSGKRILQKSFQLTEKRQDFSVRLKDVGIYLAVLSDRDQEKIYDSQILVVTDIGLFYLSDVEQTIICTVKTNSEIISDVELFLVKDQNVILKSKTDKDGLARFKEDFDMIIAKKDNSYTVSYVYIPYRGSGIDKKLFFITDRPIYKPKDVVNFKGQLLKKDAGVYTALGATKVQVVILDPKENEIYNKSLTTDELGGFWDSLKLAETAAIGFYDIEISHDDSTFFESFLVEEYRKPEYKVEIQTSKEEYISTENIEFLVNVKYFNELPVAAANVAFYVYAYSDLDGEVFLAYRGYELTDENGQLRISLKPEEGFQGKYSIKTIVTDESQRQIEQEKTVYVHADNVKILLDEDSISTRPGEKLSIKAKITDLAGNPLDGEMTVQIDGQTSKVMVINGEASIEFLPQKIGRYKIELSFQRAKKYAYVYSYFWSQDYAISEFALITDKEIYKINEQVLTQIFSPEKTTGIIALVGDRIYATQFVKIQGYASINLPIPKETSERYFFVVFLAYSSDGKRISETKKIEIERQFNIKNLQIHFDKDIYQPKEEAKLVITSDEDFSFSLALVDEAIYSMLGAEPISIEDVIYPYNEYPHVYWEFSNFWTYLTSGFVRSQMANLPQEKTFEDFKKNAVESRINVREYFPDTALWIPNLRTDNGKATVIFKVPDSLTTFIATAYGFSQKNMAQADGKFIVTKDFYVRPILPTFFREGDIVQISATVFNQTSETLKTNLWLELPNSVELISTQPRQIDSFNPVPLQQDTDNFYVQPKSTGSSYWTVRALKESDPSTITTFASANFGLTDAVALNVPVKPFAFEREFYILEFMNGLKTINLPDGEYKQAKLTVYSSIVPLLEGSIKKLIRYPYGCTEQTMSSFLPAIVAVRMDLRIDNLEDIVEKGLMRLYKYQHFDGGWGWWQNDESNDFMTCYVMEGLYHARKAGFDIADSLIEKGLDYLKEHPSAYGSYILDLYGIEHKIYQAKKDIDWIYLSLSSKEAFEKALELLKQDERFAFIPTQDDFFTSDVQLTSIVLRALSKWKGNEELQKKIINYLMSKKDGYFWYSTKDTSFAVLALLESLPQISEPRIIVKNDGKITELVGQGQIDITKGTLTVEGNGLAEIHVIYYERPTSAVNEGLGIQRKFFKRYEIPVIDQKAVIDAFIPISQYYVPVSVKLLDEFKSDELCILPYESGEYSYRNTKLKIEDFELTMNYIVYKFKYIRTLDGLILIVLEDNSAMIYDTSSKTAKIYFDILDAALTKSGLVYLKDKKLWINDKPVVDIPEDVIALSCTGSEILLRALDKTYWFTENHFVELPFIAEHILDWDGKRAVFKGGFRFSGNDETITNQLCEVVFQEETWPISISSGDIVKTIITLESGKGNYVVVEDYFPSCAQVLDRYREKVLQDYSKFDYMWYRSWDRWYTASEVHEDRIVFFISTYYPERMGYVWRVTANGKYQVLPARAYSMYYKGLYGQSDPDVLDIGVWFEVEKSK